MVKHGTFDLTFYSTGEVIDRSPNWGSLRLGGVSLEEIGEIARKFDDIRSSPSQSAVAFDFWGASHFFCLGSFFYSDRTTVKPRCTLLLYRDRIVRLDSGFECADPNFV